MNKYVFTGLLLCLCVAVRCQELKKMTVNELQEYIAASKNPLVVSFWATWCASCNEELPYFISTLDKQYNNQVELLLVSLDIKSYYPQRIKAFAAGHRYTVPLVWLNESNADVFCPVIDSSWSGAIPSTLMVNNQTHYRKFYETGITPLQFNRDINLLLGKP